MIDIKRLFVPKTDRSIEEQLSEAEKRFNLTSDLARKCLSSPDFKEYRDSYASTEKAIVDSLIAYTKAFVEGDRGDINKYALTVVRMMTKLQHLRYLVKEVENDAKRQTNEAG